MNFPLFTRIGMVLASSPTNPNHPCLLIDLHGDGPGGFLSITLEADAARELILEMETALEELERSKVSS